RHAAVRIVDIAEHDCLSRTDRLTRSNNLAVVNFPILELSLNLRVLNALHAVSALLHHTAAADRHFRIAHQLIRRLVPVLIKEEIEPSHFVRAVVRTILRAHTAVVDHVVQTFSAVDGGVDRTHGLARRVLAVHAWHRHELDALRMSRSEAFEISMEPTPVHLPTANHFMLADYRNVVLRLAGDCPR